MKKFFVMGLGLSAVFAMTSCKSSESAYKKAYEKASDACYSLDNNLHGH